MKYMFPAGGIGSPDVSWSLDGSLVAVVGDEQISIWESQTGRRVGLFEAAEDSFENKIVGWGPNSRSVAAWVPSDDTVKVWEIDGGRQITTTRTGMIQALMERLRSEK